MKKQKFLKYTKVVQCRLKDWDKGEVQ